MSGTSLDGIDVAMIETDGARAWSPGPALTIPYPDDVSRKAALGARRHRPGWRGRGRANPAPRRGSRAFSRPIIRGTAVDLVGFHGHTILHRPAERRTWQLGDGAALARRLGIDVVADFRSADVAAGGEGAPLAPLYHAALAAALPKPVVILNLGGVANLTWIGAGGIGEGGDILAFDTGPGNALIDDWVRRHTGGAADIDGALARAGYASEAFVARFLERPFFARTPPKSLDRDEFRDAMPEGFSLENGAATLTEMTAAAVAAARRHFPAPARQWLACGGGRHNLALMAALARRLGAPLHPVEAIGWNGDALEAQAFAYLAVRSAAGLPLSLPSTTGVPHPTTGGRLFPGR